MPLIACYECGASISDLASACPHCGAPAMPAGVRQPRTASPADAGKVAVWRVAAAYAVALVGMLAVFGAMNSSMSALVRGPDVFLVPLVLVVCFGVGCALLAALWIAPVRHLCITIAVVGVGLMFITRSAVESLATGTWRDPVIFEQLKVAAAGVTIMACGLIGLWLQARRQRRTSAPS